MVQEPPAVEARLTLVLTSPNGFEIVFVGPFGGQYILQQSASLDGPWVAVPGVQKPLTAAGLNEPLKVALPSTASPAAFYRFTKP